MSLPRWIQASGVRNWLLQRLTAVILLMSLAYLGYIFVCTEISNFTQWVAITDSTVFVVLFLLSMASLLIHAWVGLWTIITDYVPKSIQSLVSTVLATILVALFVWSCVIIL
jgi:succinate dehydrogenase / fumarate reductase membrane anchor subunit